jgi:ABC-type antimicrobial peptide transport system permease subunit
VNEIRFAGAREIGILKSLGTPRSFIVAMILRESAILCCLGELFGTGIGEVFRKAVVAPIPTLQVAMGFDNLMRGWIVGLAAGMLDA